MVQIYYMYVYLRFTPETSVPELANQLIALDAMSPFLKLY